MQESTYYMTGTTSVNLHDVANGEAPNDSTVPSTTPVNNVDSAATTAVSGVPEAFAGVPTVAASAGNQHASTGGEERGEKEDAEVKETGQEKKKKPETAGVGQIFFKYATALELIYMFLGTCSAVLTG